MIRVVLDTNVFVSSFFGGNPRRIVDFWKTGEILLCTSKPIIDEYIEVLGRLGLHNQRELEELLNLFAQGFHILFAAKTPQIFVVEEDPVWSDYILNSQVFKETDRRFFPISTLLPISEWLKADR